ncbi:MAG: peptide chain release factor 1 [Chloroflexota bacterium]
MIDKLAGIENRYNELEKMMGDPEVASDYELVAKYAKERSDIQPIVQKFREYRSKSEAFEEAKEMLRDPEMRELAEMEVEELKDQLPAMEEELKVMLLPKDPRDDKNVVIEIRAGAGGDEAALFAADLYRLYTRYAEANKYKYELLTENETGGGGFSQIKFTIKGDGAYSRYKYESGVHRVQRVPETESQGRIHTSTVTVAVLAELEDVDVELNLSDVRVDVFRSQGAGGQSVNTTDSAVRLTHEPTGIVVEMQDERSQLQNKLRAFTVLRNRLYEAEVERQRSEQEAERRSQIGSGDRSEKIRTYNYPQSRVTDHRINYSSYNLGGVMDGKLDEFIDELATQEQADRLAAVGTGEA